MIEDNTTPNVLRFPVQPKIIPRSEHNISRSNIDDKALKVLYRLKTAGYKAYLVGGSVRDLLLGREPKDFDIATDALPEQVRELFRNCRLIGRRFRLAHVHFGPEIIEVATFRANFAEAEGENYQDADGRIIRDNVYGDIDEDAWRRDFTVNALYYNIEDFSVVDYVNGMEDIKKGQLRLIGEPYTRYREDPVRMLRAIRFAVKLGFTIHPDTEAPIFQLNHLLDNIPAARLFEETIKLFMFGSALQGFEMLRHYNLFKALFPLTESSLSELENGFPNMLLVRALGNCDARITDDKPVTPGFLFAAILWDPMQRLYEDYCGNNVPNFDALRLAADAVISKQIAKVSIPRRYTRLTREIWSLQPKFQQRGGKKPYKLITHPRFRAAYDFLLLRAESGEPVKELAAWWTEFQHADEVQRKALQNKVLSTDKRNKRR